MLKAFVFSWNEDVDDFMKACRVVVLAENVESARAHLLEDYLKRFRSEWRRLRNENIAKSAGVVEYELKQGVLWYDEANIW